MNFSTPSFLFIFLPVFVLCCVIFRKSLANLILIVISLLFYAWGEPRYFFLLLISLAVNYALAFILALALKPGRRLSPAFWLGLAVVLNLSLLIGFKYLAFLAESWNLGAAVMGISWLKVALPPALLPLGISFFTFSAISYLVDIYRGQARFERNPLSVALYISFFPKLLAGPIVQYHQMQEQIARRTITSEKMAHGIQRFIIGLAKKVLIANTLGSLVDPIFAVSPDQLTMASAWLGCLAYTLQIYFDFSGYSDMAIGLAQMAGFDWAENFNYPYIAGSVQQFWRRWHISLSNWFRDYLYIPLGGNRRSRIRVYFNLLVVFLLCGLWHGAAKTFVVWGAWQGIFITLEHAGFSRVLKKIGSPLGNLYLLLVVMFGWVIFRSPGLPFALAYFKSMLGFSSGLPAHLPAGYFINPLQVLVLLLAVLLALPIWPRLKQFIQKSIDRVPRSSGLVAQFWKLGWLISGIACLGVLLVLAVLSLSGSLNHPFIYFKF
jgi:alginate O-acetyltransferase complex protein AlgI